MKRLVPGLLLALAACHPAHAEIGAVQEIRLAVVKDTLISRAVEHRNFGRARTIALGEPGQMALFGFDLDALDLALGGRGTIVSAALELPIVDASGRPGLVARRLTAPWIEGSGTESARGEGRGVTWHCRVDRDISDRKPACADGDDFTRPLGEARGEVGGGLGRIDVTELVERAVDVGAQLGFGVSAEGGELLLPTREAGEGAELIVRFRTDGATSDFDGDGVGRSDNCPDVANADQCDIDGDGVGDACDEAPTLAIEVELDRELEAGRTAVGRAHLYDLELKGRRLTLADAPAGLAFDGDRITWRPRARDAGHHTIRFEARDSSGARLTWLELGVDVSLAPALARADLQTPDAR